MPALAQAKPISSDEMLAADMGRFFADPLGFVLYAYDWENDPTIRVVKMPYEYRLVYPSEYGPDGWACEFLAELGEEVKARGFVPGGPAVDPIRMTRVSGHGIGKSVMAAWLADWIMCTRPHSRGTVTANTREQLATKTWAEIARWTKKCIAGHWFHVSTGRGAMAMRHKRYPESWYCTAQTCDEENSEAFAGQHAATATSFYIFDESSRVPDKINEVSEGGLTDGEPMKFAFGNGTQNTGWFFNAYHRMRHRWNTGHIDSRTVQITNKKLIQETIDDYGIDSDLVKVRVRGMFPSQSAKQFISTKDVDAATARHLRVDQYDFAPKILTLDNAWEGDDEGVIGLRQGLHYRTLRYFAKNDNDIQIALLLADLEDQEQADAVFIDAGYGTGVYSAGTTLGREWTLVWFSAESPDPGYLNLRSYMYGQGRDWLKAGGALDSRDIVLQSDLTAIETVPRMDGKIQLEAKKDLKRRGLPSPGRGDAWALSFAFPVTTRKPRGIRARLGLKDRDGGVRETDAKGHDPYANLNK